MFTSTNGIQRNVLWSGLGRGVAVAAMIACLGLLSACDDPVEAPRAAITLVNTAPIVAGDTVVLSGQASADAKKGTKKPLLYSWRFVSTPSGSAAAFSDDGLDVTSFSADVYGNYVVGLIVSNGYLSSKETRLTVTVTACGNGVPAVQSVTPTPAAPNTGELVTLTTAVIDADNAPACALNQSLTVLSEFVGRPAGSKAELSPAEGLAPSFVADIPGSYVIRTTVTDDTGLSSFADTTIAATTCGTGIPTVDSSTPAPATPNTGDLVTLATVVSDTDNSACALNQSLTVLSEFVGRPAGSKAELSPAEGLAPAFVADIPGSYVIRTTVTDDTGLSSFVDIAVTAVECGNHVPDALVDVLSPVAAAPGKEVVTPIITTGVPVQLNAASSSDADEAEGCGLEVALEYRWTILAVPADSNVTFNDATIVNPTFTPDEPGIYEVELAVTDGMFTDYAYVTVEVDPSILIGKSAGHEVEWVAGGTYWSNPEGIAVHSATGDIYVVQNGSDVLTRISGGTTTYFSAGGYLQTIHDVVYYAPADALYVTSNDFDAIIKVDAEGAQSLWTAMGGIDSPRGLDIFTNAAGAAQLVVASQNDDRVEFFNPATVANASSTGSYGFDGDRFGNPWGATGAAIAGTNTYFATENENDELWRSNGADGDRLYNNFNNPKDVVVAPSGALIVADAGSGIVYTVPNCTSGSCGATMLAWGNWEPWGLAFESDTQLLVTDRAGNALYRITGTF